MVKKKSENWRVCYAQIEKSILTPNRDVKTALKALQRYSEGSLSATNFDHKATNLKGLMRWANTNEGFFFWANIYDNLKKENKNG